jgi:hypothetical protein
MSFLPPLIILTRQNQGAHSSELSWYYIQERPAGVKLISSIRAIDNTRLKKSIAPPFEFVLAGRERRFIFTLTIRFSLR